MQVAFRPSFANLWLHWTGGYAAQTRGSTVPRDVRASSSGGPSLDRGRAANGRREHNSPTRVGKGAVRAITDSWRRVPSGYSVKLSAPGNQRALRNIRHVWVRLTTRRAGQTRSWESSVWKDILLWGGCGSLRDDSMATHMESGGIPASGSVM